MHVLISWDIISKGDDALWKQVNEELRDCFQQYSWVKPLSTLYIVEIDDNDDRREIKSDLVDVCKSYDISVHVIVSPAMKGGTYGGMLPKSLWPKIRKRTEG